MRVSGDVVFRAKREAEAASTNEQITRKRVDALEPAVSGMSLLLSRPLMGRLKWLLLGR